MTACFVRQYCLVAGVCRGATSSYEQANVYIMLQVTLLLLLRLQLCLL